SSPGCPGSSADLFGSKENDGNGGGPAHALDASNECLRPIPPRRTRCIQGYLQPSLLNKIDPGKTTRSGRDLALIAEAKPGECAGATLIGCAGASLLRCTPPAPSPLAHSGPSFARMRFSAIYSTRNSLPTRFFHSGEA